MRAPPGQSPKGPAACPWPHMLWKLASLAWLPPEMRCMDGAPRPTGVVVRVKCRRPQGLQWCANTKGGVATGSGGRRGATGEPPQDTWGAAVHTAAWV